MQRLLSGNQAVALGAWEAGVKVAAGYPGTPSSEVLEEFATYAGAYAEWSVNEKVALDVAIGAAYVGVRAMAVMKQVGLNVASDALFYASATGLAAGLVVVVADDPGMHSSQDDQDSRRYAKFARLPCLEPSDSQEARELVATALALSEQFDVPVMLRTTTRIAHAHSAVEEPTERAARPATEPPHQERDIRKYAMAPAFARARWALSLERLEQLSTQANTLTLNTIELRDRALGVVTTGVAYQYVREALPNASVLKLGMSFPLPGQLLSNFATQVERLVVIEEQDPFIEQELRILGLSCEGRDLFATRNGELSPASVRQDAQRAGLIPGDSPAPPLAPPDLALPERPPSLCPGCPHRGVFVITNRLGLVVNGDIGCYALGMMPPLNAVHTCGCMGASIGVAHGAAKAGVAERHVAVIGDSTFLHSGMPALLNAVYNQSNTVTIIMDNQTTAMTGNQPHPSSGRTLQTGKARAASFEQIVRALGVEQVQVVDPYQLDQVQQALEQCLRHDGPAVMISQRACALSPAARRDHAPLRVQPDRCVACGACLRVGCPALVLAAADGPVGARRKVEIDPLTCTGCEICAQVCPSGAILFRDQMLPLGGEAVR